MGMKLGVGWSEDDRGWAPPAGVYCEGGAHEPVGHLPHNGRTSRALLYPCEVCGAGLWFDTDGSGGLVEYYRDGRRHRFPGPPEGE